MTTGNTAADAGLLILRVAVGLTMAAHGYQKFFSGGRIPGTAGWFDGMGMRPGRVHAILAATTEVVAGVLIALGFLTALAAAAFVALMVVAGWTVHRGSGFFIVKGGWEYNFVLAIVAIGVAAIGPGAYSIDNALDLGVVSGGWWSLVIAGGVGIVAGVGQLVVFYRPPTDAT